MKRIVRTTLATLAIALPLAPVLAYALAVTVGAGSFDCVPMRFRNQNPAYSATYDILAPDGRTLHHLDAPGMSIPGHAIQTGTVEGCTYRGQPLLERLANTPYCHVSRAIETILYYEKNS